MFLFVNYVLFFKLYVQVYNFVIYLQLLLIKNQIFFTSNLSQLLLHILSIRLIARFLFTQIFTLSETISSFFHIFMGTFNSWRKLFRFFLDFNMNRIFFLFQFEITTRYFVLVWTVEIF